MELVHSRSHSVISLTNTSHFLLSILVIGHTVVGKVKCGTIQWVGHVDRTNIISVGKAFEKGPRGGTRRRETNNIEINLRKKYCEYSKWTKLA